ncbi:unnamed protein product [Miscanthus lutarioriparius]|uniref:Leucine-rich repeat-containing N-terminal plant-type domain-containing protein n=1 Tax=Miscanthus lutarioriparius TaxID=422564 RepID=A0A811SMS2_9POAL|nr:unnamed protein product [Miscanthus lutarioriparius]
MASWRPTDEEDAALWLSVQARSEQMCSGSRRRRWTLGEREGHKKKKYLLGIGVDLHLLHLIGRDRKLKPLEFRTCEFFTPLAYLIIITMKAAATGRFLLVLMACRVHAVTCSSSNTTPGNQTDRLSLLEFKNSISLDPQQALASCNDSTHFCNWEGVTCRTTSNRVTNLDLGNRGLVGQISPSLGNQTFLKQLSLATNRFSGQIPAALGQLHRLQTLYLSNNTLHGVIPTFGKCSNLEILWLNGNNLVGGFLDLPLGLKQLELGSNYLSGTIPPSLANITTLKGFGFYCNNIEGNFPHEFAKFPEL